jgi:hypothetical protein
MNATKIATIAMLELLPFVNYGFGPMNIRIPPTASGFELTKLLEGFENQAQ